MKRAERVVIAAEKAKAILPERDYEKIISAIDDAKKIRFFYTDRYGDRRQYSGVFPLSFFEFPRDPDWPGSLCLWCRHEVHNHKEQFLVDRIEHILDDINLVEALVDPSESTDFWAGEISSELEALE